MHRVRIGSASDVCRVVFPLSPHGVMFVIIAPKVPHFVGVAVGHGVGCDPQGVGDCMRYLVHGSSGLCPSDR